MSASAGRMDEEFDVVVVGASFAGLAFAGAAASRGLRTLVLERDATIGGVVRTTGVLFSDVLDVLDVPQEYLWNAVRHLIITPPNHAQIEIASAAYRFYMADVTGMLRWMAKQAERHGAVIRAGTPFVNALREPDGSMAIEFGGASELDGGATSCATCGHVHARFLVGADGARSRVARTMGLDENTKFLAGAEWLLEGVKLDGETFYLVMDHQLAPGYCVWLAPHGDLVAFGVAGHERAFRPAESLRLARALFRNIADLGEARVIQRKGGIIPVGGQLKRVYRNDDRGHALLLGDAAGLCGAATGGGIYPALISGRLAAQAVANEVLNGVPNAVPAYLKELPHAGRLGEYLKIENWIRWVMDRMASNSDLSVFYGLLGTTEGRRVLQSALLETPIIGMDGSFFGMVRGVLGRHPRAYSSVVRTAIRRAATRAQG